MDNTLAVIVGGVIAFAQAVLMLMLNNISSTLRELDGRINDVEKALGIPSVALPNRRHRRR